MASPTTNGEPFPALDDAPDTAAGDASPTTIQNRPAASSSLSGRLRKMSETFEQSDLPEGFSAATGGIASTIFARQAPKPVLASPNELPPSGREKSHDTYDGTKSEPSSATKSNGEPSEMAACPNGYHFPPPHSAGQSTKLGLIAFWKYFTTPVGFLVTIYGLNIVAWGGMLFLLLCNACKCTLVFMNRAPTNLVRAQLQPCAIQHATTSIHRDGNGSNGIPKFSTPCSA